MKRLIGLVVLLSGLLAILASGAQLLAYFEITPIMVRDFAANLLNPPPAPTPPSPVTRSAQLALIIKNVGGTKEMDRIDSLISLFAARLIPEDSISVFAFDETGDRLLMDRESGGGLAEKLLLRVGRRVNVSEVSQEAERSAVRKARDHLASSPDPSHRPAIVVLSSKTDANSLDDWFESIRSRSDHGLIFGTRIGEGNRPH